jgi:hypothetical protein
MARRSVLLQKIKNGIFVCGKCLIFRGAILRSRRKNRFLQQNLFLWHVQIRLGEKSPSAYGIAVESVTGRHFTHKNLHDA